jgi:hypothetical protein
MFHLRVQGFGIDRVGVAGEFISSQSPDGQALKRSGRVFRAE